ncbi:hypothetical protein YC2023_033459 [Brassica napus]
MVIVLVGKGNDSGLISRNDGDAIYQQNPLCLMLMWRTHKRELFFRQKERNTKSPLIVPNIIELRDEVSSKQDLSIPESSNILEGITPPLVLPNTIIGIYPAMFTLSSSQVQNLLHLLINDPTSRLSVKETVNHLCCYNETNDNKSQRESVSSQTEIVGKEVSMRPAYRSSKKVKDYDKLEAEMKKNRRMISLKKTLL